MGQDYGVVVVLVRSTEQRLGMETQHDAGRGSFAQKQLLTRERETNPV